MAATSENMTPQEVATTREMRYRDDLAFRVGGSNAADSLVLYSLTNGLIHNGLCQGDAALSASPSTMTMARPAKMAGMKGTTPGSNLALSGSLMPATLAM